MEKYHKKLITNYAPHSNIVLKVEISDIIRDCSSSDFETLVKQQMTMKMATALSNYPNETIKTRNTIDMADVIHQQYWVFSEKELMDIINSAYDDGLNARGME
jgi:hypothetical protein